MRVFIHHHPHPDWPTREHRSLAQVARTIELRALSRKLCTIELEELRSLDAKATRFNPPPEPDEAA